MKNNNDESSSVKGKFTRIYFEALKNEKEWSELLKGFRNLLAEKNIDGIYLENKPTALSEGKIKRIFHAGVYEKEFPVVPDAIEYLETHGIIMGEGHGSQ